jgi:hypothetical protein
MSLWGSMARGDDGAEGHLREHLRRLELLASEESDRQGYLRRSQADAEALGWEAEAVWPEE